MMPAGCGLPLRPSIFGLGSSQTMEGFEQLHGLLSNVSMLKIISNKQ